MHKRNHTTSSAVKQMLVLTACLATLTVIASILWTSGTLEPTPKPSTLSWSDARDALEETRPIWEETQDLVRSGAYHQAEWNMETLLQPVWEGAANRFPEQTWPTRKNRLSDWVVQREDEYRSLLETHFSHALHRVATGHLSPQHLEAWMARNSTPTLESALQAAEENITRSRIDRATNWYRIVFQSPAPEWLTLEDLQSHLEQKTMALAPLQTVWGPALTEEEQQRTAATLWITGMVQTAEFTPEAPRGILAEREWQPDPLIIGVSLFPQEISRTVTSAWSTLNPVFVWKEPPNAITQGLEEEIQSRYRSSILRDLWGALRTWPEPSRSNRQQEAPNVIHP